MLVGLMVGLTKNGASLNGVGSLHLRYVDTELDLDRD